MKQKPEIIENMPFADYRAAPGLSQSELKCLLDGPGHMLASRFGSPPTESMKIGTMAHDWLLERKWPNAAFKPPGMNLATKEGKIWKAEQIAADREIYPPEVGDFLTVLPDRIQQHPMAKQLFDAKGRREVSVFATDPDSGIRLKCRVDLLPDRGNTVADVKKTCKGGASRGEFAKAVMHYGYHIQAGHYLHVLRLAGIERDVFAFVCCEESEPWPVEVWPLEADIIALGHATARKLLGEYADLQEGKGWAKPLELPGWIRAKMEGEL